MYLAKINVVSRSQCNNLFVALYELFCTFLIIAEERDFKIEIICDSMHHEKRKIPKSTGVPVEIPCNSSHINSTTFSG